MEAKKWLINWFEANSDTSLIVIEESIDKNAPYFAWIDSMKLVELIDEIEDTFQIEFLHQNFQDKKFATIGGLSEIINEKVNENKLL